MKIAEIIPRNGEPQRIYCERCGENCDLSYRNFEEDIEGVRVKIDGLPILLCPSCAAENLPDRSRVFLVHLHDEALKNNSASVSVKRRKLDESFQLTDVPFVYDPDDYYYIPGLTRPWDRGFLQPVFFKRGVLFKYDNVPDYRVHFASTTYGTIYMSEHYISFGINRHGNVVMWLGDIGKLSESEQYYLRSENIPSDHSLGSEFYDGQIEVKFTDPTAESKLLAARSDFLELAFVKFGTKLGQLDNETFEVAEVLNRPVIDTQKERRHVADAFNKVYIESFDNKALESVRTNIRADDLGSGSLKRLQAILKASAPSDDIAAVMMPLFVLYDLRVAYSHIGSAGAASSKLGSIMNRLGLSDDADLQAVYDRLVDLLTNTFQEMIRLIKKAK